ncbi:MAG: DUF3168 domain-containing protein [Rhodobacteraceae bacterium CG17_big_fil_post_rev_8_21_14_2_50_65_11]|nr:MAG: DUF3168 domain-containing protein [Rhodobacteraceae bacterium CG17_big_fil_post_rev_8_21_14_2_50_65_11]
MSYGMTAALQMAIYNVLSGDGALAAIVGGHVYDALPPGPLPPLHVTLGPEKVRDRSDVSAGGAEHEISVIVTSSAAGFHAAKEAAAAVSDALLSTPLSLSRGRVARLHFYRAKARRKAADRLVEVWFRARLDEDTG